MSDDLPDVYFGHVGARDYDWREVDDEEEDDDEELKETPKDVVELLGFDPKGVE